MNPIHEEPHFESMICVNPEQVDHTPMTPMYASQVCVEEPIDEREPALLRAVPHALLACLAALYLVAGAFVFRLVDETLAEKPFHIVLLWSYQVCSTIGWGDSSSTTMWSRAFCTAYIILGVPLLFSAMANLGRMLTKYYCVDWLYFGVVVRGKKGSSDDEVSRQLPVARSIGFLVVHQFVGQVLLNGPINDFGPFGVLYFSYTSMATWGVSDFVPTPKSTWECAILIVYIVAGVLLLCVLITAISYRVQYFCYVTVQGFLRDCSQRKERRKIHQGDHKKTDQRNGDFGNGYEPGPYTTETTMVQETGTYFKRH
ncbi:Twik (KCNK-like) family of potassium channelsalpha subunit 5 [Aphelenchoides avenae]|nr:Twik (KCNK-like) family of potassium channelsalpha subunit 5 [Aphelenchus avenae]